MEEVSENDKEGEEDDVEPYDFEAEVRKRMLELAEEGEFFEGEEEVEKRAHVEEVSENDGEGEEDDVEPYDFEAEVRKKMLALAEEKDVDESEMVTQQSEEPCHSEAQSSLVEWPPIRGIAVEEVSMDVADIKPVKTTLLEEHDIEWWLQQARCQKKFGNTKTG